MVMDIVRGTSNVVLQQNEKNKLVPSQTFCLFYSCNPKHDKVDNHACKNKYIQWFIPSYLYKHTHKHIYIYTVPHL